MAWDGEMATPDRNVVKLEQTDPMCLTQNPRLGGKQATEARKTDHTIV